MWPFSKVRSWLFGDEQDEVEGSDEEKFLRWAAAVKLTTAALSGFLTTCIKRVYSDLIEAGIFMEARDFRFFRPTQPDDPSLSDQLDARIMHVARQVQPQPEAWTEEAILELVRGVLVKKGLAKPTLGELEARITQQLLDKGWILTVTGEVTIEGTTEKTTPIAHAASMVASGSEDNGEAFLWLRNHFYIDPCPVMLDGARRGVLEELARRGCGIATEHAVMIEERGTEMIPLDHVADLVCRGWSEVEAADWLEAHGHVRQIQPAIELPAPPENPDDGMHPVYDAETAEVVLRAALKGLNLVVLGDSVRFADGNELTPFTMAVQAIANQHNTVEEIVTWLRANNLVTSTLTEGPELGTPPPGATGVALELVTEPDLEVPVFLRGRTEEGEGV